MNEEQIRDLFREMRDEAVPRDSLARVRMGVAERTRRSSRWRVAGWVTACAAVAFAGLMLQSGVFVQRAIETQLRESPLPIMPKRTPVQPAIHRVRVHPRPEPAVFTASAEPVSIRIETPDPEVVIWLVGQ